LLDRLELASRLRETVARPFKIEDLEVGLTCSMGVAGGDSAEAARASLGDVAA
jgi:GGDEF domain-containing protein